MADPGPGRAGSADGAQDWSGLLAAVMAGGVPGGLVFDGSVESLGSLQQFVRRSVADPYWLLDPDHEDDMIGLVGYLGQTLLAIAGGTWGWESDSDVLALVWPQVSAQGPRSALAELQWDFTTLQVNYLAMDGRVCSCNPWLGVRCYAALGAVDWAQVVGARCAMLSAPRMSACSAV